MTYDEFLEEMRNELQNRFVTDLPTEYADVRIGIRDVEKLQGDPIAGFLSEAGIFRSRPIST